MEMVNTADNSNLIFAYNSSINNWYSTAYLYPQSSYVCKVWNYAESSGSCGFLHTIYHTNQSKHL